MLFGRGNGQIGKMFKLISQIPLNYVAHSFSFPLTLPMSLTFSVTYKCNFKCKTCNIWQNNNGGNELDLSQIESIFHSLGKSLYWITIDGGEPFLRKDLADICDIIYRNCKPAIINIPSNGSLPKETVDCVKRILRLCPNANIIINLSLDHIGEKHDEIRGYPGSFELLLKTYQGLNDIRHPRLRLGINTVISNYNIKDWEMIYSFAKELASVSHLFEIAQLRDEFRNRHLNNIVPQKESSILLLRELSHIKQINTKNILGKCLHSIRKNYYALIEKTIIWGRQVIPCFAAVASAYILPDGRVWSCCNNACLMGDLKEYNFDFKKLWWAKSAKDIRKRIKTNKCFCTQVNANYLNLLHSPFYFGKLIYDVLAGR